MQSLVGNMQKIEVTGQIDNQGKLVLEHLPLPNNRSRQVKVVVSYPDGIDVSKDPDDTPIEEIEAGLRRAFQERKEGKTMSLEQMWEEVEND